MEKMKGVTPVNVKYKKSMHIIAAAAIAVIFKVPFYAPEYTANADVPIYRYAFLLFRQVIPGRECNNRPAIRTISRCCCRKCTYPY